MLNHDGTLRIANDGFPYLPGMTTLSADDVDGDGISDLLHYMPWMGRTLALLSSRGGARSLLNL